MISVPKKAHKRPAPEITNTLPPKAQKQSQSPPKDLELGLNNQLIIDELNKVLEIHRSEGDEFRVISYRKAIASIAKHPFEIRSKEDALKIPGIGASISDKM